MPVFTDQVVLVTGAASVIGYEMARQFGTKSATVCAADLIVQQRGRIDVLGSNAGTGSTTDLLDCTVEEWDRVFAVNARGVFLARSTSCRTCSLRRAGSSSTQRRSPGWSDCAIEPRTATTSAS